MNSQQTTLESRVLVDRATDRLTSILKQWHNEHHDGVYRYCDQQPGPVATVGPRRPRSAVLAGRLAGTNHAIPAATGGIMNDCGTRSGYRAHRAANEEPCPPCKAANAARQASYRARRRANDDAPLVRKRDPDPYELLKAAVTVSRDWAGSALCAQVDPDIWFPEKGENARVHEAKAICRKCPVQLQCLQEALDRSDRWGIWGGFSEIERRDLKRRRKAA